MELMQTNRSKKE